MAAMLFFCRVVIGLAFGLSVAGKLGSMVSFQQAMRRFRILPDAWVLPAAWLFLVGEMVCVLLIAYGGDVLPVGFVLAFLLLVVFSVALVSVLVRRISTSCNCFGASQKAVTWCDAARNIGFLACALGGWGAAGITQPGPIGWLEAGLAAVCAIVYVVFLTHLGEIVQTLS